MAKQKDYVVDRVRSDIERIFADQTVTKQETLERLEIIATETKTRIDALKENMSAGT